MNVYFCSQVKLEREKKYSEESFWLRTVSLRENFTEDKFTNLFEVQSAINKIYNLALANNLGKDIIGEWQQHVIVIQSLLDDLGTRSHKTALKDLKKVFGGNRGLNEDNRRLVDSTSCPSPNVQTSKIWPTWICSTKTYVWWMIQHFSNPQGGTSLYLL